MFLFLYLHLRSLFFDRHMEEAVNHVFHQITSPWRPSAPQFDVTAPEHAESAIFLISDLFISSVDTSYRRET
jgi:hypothetical protein